jgi:molecular chaperone GrpE (heat shock protein)
MFIFWKYISDQIKYQNKLAEEQRKTSESRENLIRNESADREQMNLAKAEKREERLLTVIDNQNAAMERVADTLDGVKTAMTKMESRMTNMDGRMNNMEVRLSEVIR